jgi:hypothetical protein
MRPRLIIDLTTLMAGALALPASWSSTSRPGKVVGEVADVPGAHGVALVPDINLGFATYGKDNFLGVFDLKTLILLSCIGQGEVYSTDHRAHRERDQKQGREQLRCYIFWLRPREKGQESS